MDKEEKLQTICKWINEDIFGDELIEIVEAIARTCGQHFPTFFVGGNGNVTDALLDVVDRWRDAIRDREPFIDELMRQLETYGRCTEIQTVKLAKGWESAIKIEGQRFDNGTMNADLQIENLKRYIRLVDLNGVEWYLHGERWFPDVTQSTIRS
jgi:hypothetical protein